MSATDFPDPTEFGSDLVVRGNNVCLNDYVIVFPIRAQALAFAWMLMEARNGYYIMSEPEGYNATATGFALEMEPHEIVGPFVRHKEDE
jgi:hypothetical protein